jgi:AcrR family transcriptional regulator
VSRLRVVYARRTTATATARSRVLATVREMLEEGVFHESTVEEVAARAGVSRATLYQHFGNRLGLIDAICDLMAENTALAAVREARDSDEFIGRVVEFWASEESMLVQIYGVSAVDPAARAFVERQRRDRYGEIRRILAVHGRNDRARFAAFAGLTSFATYVELRRGAGLSKRETAATLQRLAAAALAA